MMRVAWHLFSSVLWNHHGCADMQHMLQLQFEGTGFGLESWEMSIKTQTQMTWILLQS